MWPSALHFFSLLSWFVPRPNSAPLAFCAAFFLPQPLYWYHSYSNGPQQEQNQTQAAHKSSLPRPQGRHKPPPGLTASLPVLQWNNNISLLQFKLKNQGLSERTQFKRKGAGPSHQCCLARQPLEPGPVVWLNYKQNLR